MRGAYTLQRSEAIALLKEIIGANLVQPSFIHVKENQHGHYDLIIKDECDPVEIRRLIAKKDLALLVDKEKDTCRIYRP